MRRLAVGFPVHSYIKPSTGSPNTVGGYFFARFIAMYSMSKRSMKSQKSDMSIRSSNRSRIVLTSLEKIMIRNHNLPPYRRPTANRNPRCLKNILSLLKKAVKGLCKGFWGRTPSLGGGAVRFSFNSPVGCEWHRDRRRGIADGVAAVPAAATE